MLKPASLGHRSLAHIIDVAIVFSPLFIMSNGSEIFKLIFLLVGMNILLEVMTGGSMGKQILMLKIVSKNGGKASARAILDRYLYGMLPFEVLSNLKDGTGTSGKMTDTLVISKK